MEVSVYMNLEALKNNKAVFKRFVASPDAFDVNAFVKCMKAIFSSDIVINVLYT